MDATHFSDTRIEEIQDGTAPMTTQEREYLINDTPRFEECGHTEAELAAMTDVDLMTCAYWVWREYVRSM